MCGQSGSGKTYSLGLLLERVLAETELRVIILDPNSDYVGLGRVRAGAAADAVERYRDVPGQVAVWGNDERADHRLRLRFAELDTAAQAAVLGLDPVRDRDEYGVLAELLRQAKAGAQLISGLEQLTESLAPAPGSSACEPRTSECSSGTCGHATGRRSSRSWTARPRRCTVVDLGSLNTAEEQGLVAQAVLSKLWTLRQTRQPCLVVIDEAHNICAVRPGRPARRTVHAADRPDRGGGPEVRSLPARVHPGAAQGARERRRPVRQRGADADELAVRHPELTGIFSFVPPGLVAGLSSFPMGKALVGGKIFARSGYVRMGARVSEEGGADIPTDWARPRP